MVIALLIVIAEQMNGCHAGHVVSALFAGDTVTGRRGHALVAVLSVALVAGLISAASIPRR